MTWPSEYCRESWPCPEVEQQNQISCLSQGPSTRYTPCLQSTDQLAASAQQILGLLWHTLCYKFGAVIPELIAAWSREEECLPGIYSPVCVTKNDHGQDQLHWLIKQDPFQPGDGLTEWTFT